MKADTSFLCQASSLKFLASQVYMCVWVRVKLGAEIRRGTKSSPSSEDPAVHYKIELKVYLGLEGLSGPSLPPYFTSGL